MVPIVKAGLGPRQLGHIRTVNNRGEIWIRRAAAMPALPKMDLQRAAA
jgi:hypothetical protein